MIPHEPLQWNGDRPRRWIAAFIAVDQPVIVRHHAILNDGEDLNEYPPTLELTWAEWQETCDKFGLNADGSRIEQEG